MKKRYIFEGIKKALFTFKEITKLAYHANKRLLIALFISNIFVGLLSFPGFYLEKLAIDSLVEITSTGLTTNALQILILLIIGRLLIQFIQTSVSSFTVFIGSMLSRYVSSHIDYILAQKISNLQMFMLEDPDFQDRVNKIQRTSGRRAWEVVSILSNIPSSLASFISAIILLFSLNPYIAFGIILFSLPQFLISRKYIKLGYALETKLSVKHRMWGWYYYFLMQSRNYMELKILGLSDYLSTNLKNTHNEIMAVQMNLQKKERLGNISGNVPLLFFEGFVSIYTALQTISKQISIGSFEFYLRTLRSAESSVISLVNSFTQIYENYMYIKDFLWFINLDSIEIHQKGRLPIPAMITLTFDHVWFKYKKGASWVVKDISFEITAGEKIAMVGVNGAGKSTIIKLIGGFYTPQRGHVLLNGKDLFEYDIPSWRKTIAALFQDFEHYSFSVNEEIGFGDIDRLYDQEGIKEAAKKARIDTFIENLPSKYRNPLNPQFEKGVAPSIGQLQRLGIARILFRKDARLLIMDEPTSNVDPKAEAEIFEELSHLADNKILLFVTQRFSTVIIADRILVIENGKIREQGTHKELMAKSGAYYKLYTLQAKAYQQ